MIEIELHQPTYCGGDTVSGSITLAPEKDTACLGMQLEWSWRAVHKKSQVPESQGKRHTLDLTAPAERVQAGKTYSIPFEFMVPNGPASYDGQHFDVAWGIKAKVKTGGLFGTKTGQTTFTLIPNPELGTYNMGPRQRYFTSRWHWPTRMAKLGKVAFGFFLMGAGSICLLALYEEPLTFVATSPFVLIGAGFVYWQLRHWITRLFFSQLRVQVDRRTLTPGDSVICRVQLKPWFDQPIHKVHVELRAEERYEVSTSTRIGGKRQSSISFKRTPVYQQEETVLEEHQLYGSESWERTIQFTLPADSSYTFAARRNQLLWRLIVTIKAGWLPKWTKEIALVVKPLWY